MRTFLERDIPQFGFNIPSTSLFRFWSLLAHYHGQIWNNAEAARTLNVGEATARRYMDLLQDLFMVRLLQPWYANLSKRSGQNTENLFSRHPDCCIIYSVSAVRRNYYYTPQRRLMGRLRHRGNHQGGHAG